MNNEKGPKRVLFFADLCLRLSRDAPSGLECSRTYSAPLCFAAKRVPKYLRVAAPNPAAPASYRFASPCPASASA